MPQVRVASALYGANNKPIGHEHAVTVAIVPSPEGIIANINIGTHSNWTMLCASRENLTQDDLMTVNDGVVVVLFRHLQRGFELSLPRFLAHKTGTAPLADLVQIAELADKHVDYFKTLQGDELVR